MAFYHEEFQRSANSFFEDENPHSEVKWSEDFPFSDRNFCWLDTSVTRDKSAFLMWQKGNERMPPPSMNKAAHSGFETQRRHHQKSTTGVIVAPQKGLMSSNIFFKKKMMSQKGKVYTILSAPTHLCEF